MWYTRGELDEQSEKYIIKDSISRDTLYLTEDELKERVLEDGSIVGVHLTNEHIVFDRLFPEITKLLSLNKEDAIGMYMTELGVWVTLLFVGYYNNKFNFRFGTGAFSISVNELFVGRYLFDFTHVSEVSKIRESLM